MDDGTERLRGQLRDTVQRGQASEYGGDQIEDAAANGARRAVRGMEILLKRGGRIRSRKPDSGPQSSRGSSMQEPTAEKPPPHKPTIWEPPRIKTRETVSNSNMEPPAQIRPEWLPEIKTKDAYIQKQAAAEPKQPPQTFDQVQQRFRQEHSQAAAVKRETAQRLGEHTAARTRNSGGAVSPAPARCRYTPTQAVRSGGTGARPVRDGERAVVKGPPSGGKTAGRNAHQTVKTAEATAGRAVKTSQRAVRTAQQTAQATARATRRAVQTARTTAKTARATVKAAVTAVKAAIAAARSLVAAIAAGGWVAVVIILVICLAALVLFSVFGIFFSDESGDPNATSPSAAVVQLNREYTDTLSGYQAGGSYDSVEVIGRPPSWVDVFAVFSVKTVMGEHMDVVVLDADRMARLRAVFWDMTKITTETKTVEHPAEGGVAAWTETVLVITVTPRTPDDMRAFYQFTGQQNEALDALLSEGNSGLWNDLLYGAGSGSIVEAACSQVGNVGGQPYWSWYGFDSRVDWCACFVSWCADQCGYIDAGIIPKFASCSAGAQWFKARGLWQENSYVPNPGDLIFFDWDTEGEGQNGAMDHVGIVERVEGGLVYTIEGNSGDACRQRSYPVGHYEIWGYATPVFA